MSRSSGGCPAITAVDHEIREGHVTYHSAGFIFTDRNAEPDNEDWSFVVSREGIIVEHLGWGRVGHRPDVDVNPIDGPVHTVWVDVDDAGGITDAANVAIRELIAEHKDRYKECRVRAAIRVGDELHRWVEQGCPELAVDEDQDTADDAGMDAWATADA